MIYLFDDQKNRQKDYGWDNHRFKIFSDILRPIYLFNEIENDTIKGEIFSSGSIVLFHESFFDNVLNRHHKESIEIRNKLNKFSSVNKDFNIVFFSGSKNTRKLTDNVGHIPVTILYQNLEVFCNKVKSCDINLHYLLFGKNFKIEEELLCELNCANNRIEDSIENSNPLNRNFIAVTQMGEIEIPFENADCETFFTDDITDEYSGDIDKYSSDIITNWFSDKEYDNIFIPISFGITLSDFNGLRFATHLRCSNTPNRLKNIFIYSFIGLEYLLANEYFDIIKTKNVFIIDHKKSAFANALSSSFEPLSIQELPKELRKIKIDPPTNYEDSHSIANEWAIYRWALAINTSSYEIEQIINKVNNQLYFKYLNSLYPKEDIDAIPEQELKIEYSGNPKILYIDDEADKGWYEIFCKIFYDINNLAFEHLDVEFNSRTQDEIIEISMEKISKEDIDLVLLDFRLHPNDFNCTNIQEITGLKLLSEIKKLNHGIQVIMFTASNKSWSRRALFEADGYYVKESPESKYNSDFSLTNFDLFKTQVEACFNYSFLKYFYSSFKELDDVLTPRKRKENSYPLPKELVDSILNWTKLGIENLNKNRNQTGIVTSFLIFFSVLENLANRIIDIDNPKKVKKDDGKIWYMFEFRTSNLFLKKFKEDVNNPSYYFRTDRKLETTRNIPWTYKILNTFDYIAKGKIDIALINKLVKKRNDIVHANTTTGDKIVVTSSDIRDLFSILISGLMNMK